jgi:3-deoxy-D-manno-octulosonic-acid transferase
METELWPTVLASAKRHGIPVIVINARLSERSRGRFARSRSAFDALIAPNITLMAAQTEDDEARLKSLGIQNTCVTGSIKYDITPDKELVSKGEEVRKAAAGRPILTAASTHGDESLMVLRAFHEIKKKVPDALLILVPRHPEEFEKAYGESVSEGFRTKRRSADTMPSPDTEVFIGDSMGEMTVWFAASRAAFMAGSLIPVGGHNPLEPAVLGVPVITGPNYFNFEDIFRRLFDAGGAFAVADEMELAEKASELLDNPELASDAGRKAEETASKGTGACQRALDAVLGVCPGLAG